MICKVMHHQPIIVVGVDMRQDSTEREAGV